MKPVRASVLRYLWNARLVSPRVGNPLEKCDTFGAVLLLLMRRPDVRSRLAYIEVDHVIPQATVVLDRGSRTIFAAYTPREWRKRVAEVVDQIGLQVTRVPLAEWERIARLPVAEQRA